VEINMRIAAITKTNFVVFFCIVSYSFQATFLSIVLLVDVGKCRSGLSATAWSNDLGSLYYLKQGSDLVKAFSQKYRAFL
jgi:hypothetical protein